MTRRPPQTAFEYVERGWRPSLMWVLLISVALPFGAFVAVLLWAYAYAVVKAVTTGTPVPYLLGGIEHLPWQYIASGLGVLFAGYLARGRQIVQQDRVAGGAGYTPPFAPSPPASSAPPPEAPSPTGGLVNNEAIQ